MPEASSQSAASANPEQVLGALSHDLMSPYCPGRTIASCPSKAARELEADILAQAQAGKTREQIEAELVDRFGPEIVGYAGKPALVWGSAGLAVAVVVLLGWVGRRWVRRRAAVQPAATEASTPTRAELDRLDDALDAVDEF